MQISTWTNEDREDFADQIKCSIVESLAFEGTMTMEEADVWCEMHSIVLRKRSRLFRYLRKVVGKPDGDTLHIQVVKKVVKEEG